MSDHARFFFMTIQRALGWSLTWIGLSQLVALGINHYMGSAPAQAFLTGYALEKALSVDNLFVFFMIFNYFGVERDVQRRALNYGLIGVIVLRGILIFSGIELVEHFEWVMYIMGAIVIYTGFVMAFGGEQTFDPEKSHIVTFASRLIPVSKNFHGSSFFIVEMGRRVATPLLLVVVVVELMDVIFAVDSIPAIFSVTRNPFIIYSSNILAVLGLRSLYFLLQKAQAAFRFVKQGVGLILWFIGVKMIVPKFWPAFVITNSLALAVVISVLALSILLSLAIKKPKTNAA
jgi:tellurite resistance protein TerC